MLQTSCDVDRRGAGGAPLPPASVRASARALLPRQAARHARSRRSRRCAKTAGARQCSGSPALRLFQLRAELAHNRRIVASRGKSVNHHERMRIRLAQQIFRLVNFIRGVDRHEHRADLRRRPERDDTTGARSSPRSRRGSRRCTPERNQRAGEFVDVVAELARRCGYNRASCSGRRTGRGIPRPCGRAPAGRSFRSACPSATGRTPCRACSHRGASTSPYARGWPKRFIVFTKCREISSITPRCRAAHCGSHSIEMKPS